MENCMGSKLFVSPTQTKLGFQSAQKNYTQEPLSILGRIWRTFMVSPGESR